MSSMPDPALEAAAERLERQAPGYLARTRRLAAGLGLPPTPAERVARALDLVDETAQVNADASTWSPQIWNRAMKTAVGRLVRWYMLHIAGQVANLGGSVSWLGRAQYEYTAGLEAELQRLRVELDQLKARVEGMESQP